MPDHVPQRNRSWELWPRRGTCNTMQPMTQPSVTESNAWYRNPLVVDGMLAVGLFALALDQSSRWWPDLLEGDARWAITLALATLPLAARRIAPVLAGVTIFTAMAVMVVIESATAPVQAAALLTLYSAGLTEDATLRRIGRLAIIAPVAVAALVELARSRNPAPLLLVILLAGGTWLLADLVFERRLERDKAAESVLSAEKDLEERTRRAVSEERARIARELHDIIAHNVSVMVVQAGAARRTVIQQPDLAPEILESIELSGRQALGEIRLLLDVMRSESDSGALVPQPTLDQIPELVDDFERAGLAVQVDHDVDTSQLSSPLQLSAYRIIQEALTNSLRYAGVGAKARLATRIDKGRLIIEVTDTGDNTGQTSPRPGHGILGMRERAAIFGGTVTTRPRASGGFLVRAILPIGGGG